MHDAVAKKKKWKNQKKKGKTRQDLDGRIHRLAGSIGQGGRVLFGVRTRDQEFASKSINLGRSLLYASVSSRRTTYVNQRSRFLRFHQLVSGHCNLSPPSCTRYPLLPPPPVFFSILCVVTFILSLLPIFYPAALRSAPDRDTDNWTLPFSRHFWSDFVGESEMILCSSWGKILRFFHDFSREFRLWELFMGRKRGFLWYLFGFNYVRWDGFVWRRLKRINGEISK